MLDVPFSHRCDAGIEEGDYGIHLKLLKGMVAADETLIGNPGLIPLERFHGGGHVLFRELEKEEEGLLFEV
jgi:hypothetical protein